MDIYTLNVGQGQFVVVTGQTEAIIIDTFVPGNVEQDVEFVKSALSRILSGQQTKYLVGLIVTGFDADHFNIKGMKIVLNKYRPDWIMYPKYFKETDTANECFAAINEFDSATSMDRKSIKLTDNRIRVYKGLANDFEFEVFSPHASDMSTSNNCSIVCKITEKSTGASYLVTGDTESDRWSAIVSTFGRALKADVLAAPHHGSKNGATADLLNCVQPRTILVSAGVNSQYDHPSPEAVELFRRHAVPCFATNGGNGQSLHTMANGQTVKTVKF